MHVSNDPHQRRIDVSLEYGEAAMVVFALSDYLQREEDEDVQALVDNLSNPELINVKRSD